MGHYDEMVENLHRQINETPSWQKEKIAYLSKEISETYGMFGAAMDSVPKEERTCECGLVAYGSSDCHCDPITPQRLSGTPKRQASNMEDWQVETIKDIIYDLHEVRRVLIKTLSTDEHTDGIIDKLKTLMT